jgi:hypothetical protein
MAAYPFRKMTNRQLRKLLRDDQDQDESLKMPPGHQSQVTQDIPLLQNQPIPACQQSETINQ